MEKKVINLEVKDNIEPTINNLKALKRQLKDTAAGSAEFNKLSASIRDMEDAIGDAKVTGDDFFGQLENAGGPLGMLGQGIRGAERTFSSFNGALKASVIGLFVGLIGGLVAAFRDNADATKKLQPLMDGLDKAFQGVFRVVEPLFNILVDLAVSALPMVSKAMATVYSSVTAVFQSLGMLGSAVKKLISGDFSGAFKDAKASVNDFGKNYDASVKRFESGSKEMTAAEKEQAEKRKEAREKEAEKAKALREKQAQEIAEQRKKDLADLNAALKAQQDATIASQNEVTQAISDSQDRQAEIGLSATEIAIRNIQDKYFRLNELAIQQGRTEDERNILQTQKQNEIDAQNKIKADADAVTKKAKDEKDLADKKAQAEKELEIDTALQQAKRNALDTGLNLLQQFAGKNKAVALGILAVQKGLAIADIIIGASKSIGVATANLTSIPAVLPPGVPNPAFPLAAKFTAKSILTTKINAATSIASILGAGISGAKSITGGGESSGGGGGGASGGGSQPPAFNVVGASPTSQLAQTIGNQQQQPIKTYVVSKDVTSQQSLDRNIVQSATIG